MPDAERGRRLLDLLLRARRTVYVAEGLAGYDSALELGLRTMVADRIVPGDIAVATTSVADSAAFARVQAGILDPGQALAEGYRRNNAGSYAEAAEFFDSLVDRGATRNQGAQALLGEYLINRALQRSNLGLFQARGRRPGCLRGLGLVD